MANRFYNNSKVNGESFEAADVESIEAGFQGVQDELDAHDHSEYLTGSEDELLFYGE